eukprot:TRINITY_DN17686_c0_g1_i4.p11 TRINITY_DN17686_c0_g1~~TRINITY_DN17686_c0_g1_i4.p11  ORF type:complete len:119 (+),score=4.68 TRINITY_DN17686_c0_g1_i4:315-671(+)
MFVSNKFYNKYNFQQIYEEIKDLELSLDHFNLEKSRVQIKKRPNQVFYGLYIPPPPQRAPSAQTEKKLQKSLYNIYVSIQSYTMYVQIYICTHSLYSSKPLYPFQKIDRYSGSIAVIT